MTLCSFGQAGFVMSDISNTILAGAAHVLRWCLRARRRGFEAAGSSRFSRPASDGMDRKLEKYFDYRNGFFVEAGANDGYLQSNTYYLEKMRGWRGLLVEPVPELYARCCRERRNSVVVNAALVPAGYPGKEIVLHYFNTMTYTEGAFPTREEELAHRQAASSTQIRKRTYSVSIPARTLTSLFEEYRVPETFDLFSLDVEGFEVQALGGLDFMRFRPSYLLVEGNDIEGIRRCVAPMYTEAEQLSARDYLFSARSAG